jgi:two-component sensor histidine kinase
VAISDITERKQAEEQIRASLQEKEVLLQEIHHRVKNNMQVISSLLYLQADHIQDKQVRELFQESRQRVRSMALIHEQLYQSQDLGRIDFAEYIESLTHHLWRSHGASHVTLQLDIAPLLLSIEGAIPCGLIINELVSNAFKHVFPNGHTGEIWVELRSSESGQVTLIVKDNGVGLPPDFDLYHCTSLGLTLVNTLIKQQLKGTIEMRQQTRGTEFELTFGGVTNIERGKNHA